MTSLRLAEQPVHYAPYLLHSGLLAEPPPEPLNESELSWIWAGQRYPPEALTLVDGRPLRVINPGRAGGGAGPDFLDGVFEIAGATVRGDVELHVRASGFRAHGHHTDHAYDDVALHVVFRADDGVTTGLCSGEVAPIAAFAPWFDSRRDELQRWLSAEPLWREPCRDVTNRFDETAVRDTLRQAGMARFSEKAAALAAIARELGEHEALWRGLFDTLGVGGDREGFRRLAKDLPFSQAATIVKEGKAEALTDALTYIAGLAPKAASDTALPPPIKPALAATGRPANRPQRRLAGIAMLVERADCDLPAYVSESIDTAASSKHLIGAWQASRAGASLIGPDRAREIVLNLVLPFAAANPSLASRAGEHLAALAPAPAYGPTAFLEQNLRATSSRRFVRKAIEQQGLINLLRTWCSQGGCGRCPLS